MIYLCPQCKPYFDDYLLGGKPVPSSSWGETINHFSVKCSNCGTYALRKDMLIQMYTDEHIVHMEKHIIKIKQQLCVLRLEVGEEEIL